MSLYREAGGGRWRWVVLAAGVALVVGIGTGYAVGRSSAPEPTIGEQFGELQDRARPVLDGLALVPDHYSQGVRGGEVVGEVQYSGAQQQARTAQVSLADLAPEIEPLDPAGLARASGSIESLIEAIEAREDQARVEELVESSSAAVSAAVGLDPPQ
ncbi:MAG: hypothetical protein ABIZ50_06010 [Solirubrobacterales bacterium]